MVSKAQTIIEERKSEIINGIIQMLARPFRDHAIVAGNIYGMFYNYLKGKRCVAYFEHPILIGKAKVKLPEKNKQDKLLPDIMIVCNREIDKHHGIEGTPDLVVEILSAGTAKNDKSVKKDIYELIGVKEYWIVDPKNFNIEVYPLKDGKYVLDNVYHQYSALEIEGMEEYETAEIITEFKTSIFDDLIINIADVFENLIIEPVLPETGL